MVQSRPGLLFHMDLKTVHTRIINYQHYLVDIIVDNSAFAHIYCFRRKSDALQEALIMASTCWFLFRLITDMRGTVLQKDSLTLFSAAWFGQ